MPAPAEGIAEALQEALGLHWTAIETYETQASHFSLWGFPKLAERYSGYASEERGHAKKVIDRLEFFNFAPEYEHSSPDWPRHDYVGILDQNLEIETAAAAVERNGYTFALDAGDAVTAEIFAELLADSEKSIQEIEATREVIGLIGLDNYLANLV